MRLILGMILGVILVGSAQGYSDEFIPWSEDRNLTWDDFSGIPGKFPESYESGDYRVQAFTWGEQKLVEHDFEKAPSIICQYQITQLDLLSRFNRNQSWVKEQVLGNLDVLNHEQGHFDILEVIARKTESALLLKIFECPNGVYNKSVINNEIRKLVYDFTEKSQELHEQYDDETETRHNLSMQNSWDWRIDSDLKRYHVSNTDYSSDDASKPQITYGIGKESVTCKVGMMPMQKHSNNKLFCITPATVLVLEERGWGNYIYTGRDYLDP